jgi:serine/threonine-protein kinase
MAPEQATQNSKVTGATDLYALGLVAYRLLAGESYYRGPMLSVLGELLHGVVSVPSARHPHLGAGFDAWFLRACHRQPECRFASASQQIEALASAFGLPCTQPAGEPGHGAVSATVTEARPVASQRLPPKKRLVAVVGAALALLAAIFVYRAFSTWENTRRSAPEAGLLESSVLVHDTRSAMPVVTVPQPAGATAAPPSNPAPQIDAESPKTSVTASATARSAQPTPRRKPGRGLDPSPPSKAEPVPAPDPYRDQK